MIKVLGAVPAEIVVALVCVEQALGLYIGRRYRMEDLGADNLAELRHLARIVHQWFGTIAPDQKMTVAMYEFLQTLQKSFAVWSKHFGESYDVR